MKGLITRCYEVTEAKTVAGEFLLFIAGEGDTETVLVNAICSAETSEEVHPVPMLTDNWNPVILSRLDVDGSLLSGKRVFIGHLG